MQANRPAFELVLEGDELVEKQSVFSERLHARKGGRLTHGNLTNVYVDPRDGRPTLEINLAKATGDDASDETFYVWRCRLCNLDWKKLGAGSWGNVIDHLARRPHFSKFREVCQGLEPDTPDGAHWKVFAAGNEKSERHVKTGQLLKRSEKVEAKYGARKVCRALPPLQRAQLLLGARSPYSQASEACACAAVRCRLRGAS